ncbi:MAG: hypothetical protein HY671_04730 [Chloroflexi bacterium]|nr:hypothetical protein [Chloroflexota bacterium]
MLGVVPVVLLIAIIVVFVVTAYKEGKTSVSTTKRLYFYLLSFAALLVAANGLILLLNFVMNGLFRKVIAGGATPQQLALSVAFLTVGGALWATHWTYIRRQVTRSPSERESSLRKLYIYAFLFVSLALSVISFVRLLQWAFGVEDFKSDMVSPLLVWVPLWLYHWGLEAREGQPSPGARTLRWWYTYLTSFYSLAMVATGLAFVLFAVLRYTYNGAFPPSILVGEQQPLWGRGTRVALSVAIAGAPVWAWHWYKAARGELESTLRQVYLYLYAVLLGAITILTGLALGLHQTLSWLFGATRSASGADHFRALPGFIAPVIVGVMLWAYHWNTVQQEAKHLAFRLLAARRAYSYFMAALGLATVAAGLIILIPMVIDTFVPAARGVLVGGDWWRARTSWIITLLIIGVPWWSYYWQGVQRRANAGGAEERAALTRRLHIYIVLVLSMLSVLGSLVFTFFSFLQAALAGALSPDVFRRAKWGIGVFVTAALVAYYYWSTLKVDLATGAERIPRKASVTLVAGAQGKGLAPQIEEKLGYKLTVIQTLEPEAQPVALSAEQLDALVRGVHESPGNRVFLIVEDGTVRVHSYD